LTSDPTPTLRAALLAIEELRGDLLRLAARVVAVEEELTRRVAPDEADQVARAIAARTPELLAGIQAADACAPERLQLGDAIDKYEVPPLPDGGPPCLELLPLCEARCCSFTFALSTQDLDEGVVRWDQGRPYLIAHEPDGHCSHLSREGGGCTCYAERPAPCRRYDCRTDRRIWADYGRRILAAKPAPDGPMTLEQRKEAAQQRELALAVEASALRRGTSR
jgi:Fe-S-cluster containining protein